MAGMTKINHLEHSINVLEKRIQEIKKLLLIGSKNSTSSSTPRVDSSPHEVRSQRLAEERERKPLRCAATHGHEDRISTETIGTSLF